MMRTKLTTWILLIFFIASSGVRAQTSLEDTIESVSRSVVGVGSFNPLAAPNAHLKATGFVVADGRYVVTNYHVIEGIEEVEGTRLAVFYGYGDRQEMFFAKVVAEDRKNDLALLTYANPSGKKLPGLSLYDDRTELRIGKQIVFTGYPIGAVLGFYAVTHTGIISSITPIVIPADRASQLTAKALKRLKNPFFVYQLDATAYPGNSGSPVYLPDTGEVVGIVNKVFVKETKEAVLEKPSGITYAIPVSALKSLLLEAPKK